MVSRGCIGWIGRVRFFYFDSERSYLSNFSNVNKSFKISTVVDIAEHTSLRVSNRSSSTGLVHAVADNYS